MLKIIFNTIVALSMVTLWIIPAFAENYNDRFIAEDAAVIAFTHARLIDGTGAKAKEKHTVIIRDGRITKIGKDGKVKIPKDAKRISLKGKSLLPGWVMTHEHLYYGTHPGNLPSSIMDFMLTQQSISYPRLYLAAGVTSARTAGGIQPYTELAIKKAIDSGDLVGPDFDLTTNHLGAPSVFLQIYSVKDPDDARETVRYWAKRGFTSVKAYGGITHENLAAAIDEAHQHGLKVTADFGGSMKRHREAVDLGIDQLEHVIASVDEDGVTLPPKNDQVQRMMDHYINNNVSITSTLAAWDIQPIPDDVIALFTDYSRKEYQRTPFGIWEEYLGDGTYLKKQQNLVVEFWRKGGKMTVGTDPAVQKVIAGYANLRTVELMVDAGIPPLEVIKMATLNGAQAIGIAKDRGTIAVGKRADLIVIKGDPSTNIKDIYNIETVFKKGIGYKPAALKESVKGTVGGPG